MHFGYKKEFATKMSPWLKSRGALNVADIMTKVHDANFLNNLVELLGHAYDEGRSEVAPQLDLMTNNADLQFQLLLSLGISDHSV